MVAKMNFFYAAGNWLFLQYSNLQPSHYPDWATLLTYLQVLNLTLNTWHLTVNSFTHSCRSFCLNAHFCGWSYHAFNTGAQNSRFKLAWKCKLCRVANNTCGPSLQNLLLVTLLAPRILRQLLKLLENCEPLINIILMLKSSNKKYIITINTHNCAWCIEAVHCFLNTFTYDPCLNLFSPYIWFSENVLLNTATMKALNYLFICDFCVTISFKGPPFNRRSHFLPFLTVHVWI